MQEVTKVINLRELKESVPSTIEQPASTTRSNKSDEGLKGEDDELGLSRGRPVESSSRKWLSRRLLFCLCIVIFLTAATLVISLTAFSDQGPSEAEQVEQQKRENEIEAKLKGIEEFEEMIGSPPEGMAKYGYR